MAKKDELNFETDNKMASSEKLKALQAAMEKIEKSFGKGSIMKMGDDSVEQVEVIPTGSIALNVALGVGGYPRGRIIEIYGPESSGKTTLAIHAIAEAQKAGGIAAFIDAEHAFDRFYASKLGVNIDDLYISQPDNGEQALEIAEQLIRSSAIDIIVIDSVAALTPKAEIEGDMGDNKVGLQARLMSQALRKLTAAVSKTRTTCIFINQLREKIGVMFGNPETTTGGNALKFYASVRLDIRGSQPIKDGEEILGKLTKVKVVKNKVAPPFRRAEFDIMFGEGISHSGEIIDLGADLGIIKKSGSWYSYNDTKLGQGRDAAKQCIQDNPELADELEKLLKYKDNKKVLAKLEEIKHNRKLDLKQFLYETQNIALDENSIIDVQVKRLHEYKRQQMNALYAIYKYMDIKSGNKPKTPITMVFGAKAAPAYIIAKDIIHLILCLQELIDNDPEVSPYFKVIMLENYNVSKAAKVIPAADISEQISLASKEASGTGNMKFMLNGALTLGTEDGANVEIGDLVGKENIYIFGKKPQDVIDLYADAAYCSKDIYDEDPEIAKLVDFIVSDELLAIGDKVCLERLYKEILNKDWFMTLLDLEDYIKVKDQAFADYEEIGRAHV